jgi:hypothetical protein
MKQVVTIGILGLLGGLALAYVADLSSLFATGRSAFAVRLARCDSRITAHIVRKMTSDAAWTPFSGAGPLSLLRDGIGWRPMCFPQYIEPFCGNLRGEFPLEWKFCLG